MMKIAIVEDDRSAADLLKSCIARCCEKSRMRYTLVSCASAAEFSAYDGYDFDLIFMDIVLPDGNGYDIVKDMRARAVNAMVIFVTSMLDYAVMGYEVRAFDFIVKPVNEDVFSLKFRAATEHLRLNAGGEIWLNGKNFRKKLRTADVCYVDVDRHWLTYHTTEGNYTVYGALEAARAELGEGFALCNRCYLVNLRHVTASAGDRITVGGDDLFVSRNRKNAFFKALNEYMATGGCGTE